MLAPGLANNQNQFVFTQFQTPGFSAQRFLPPPSAGLAFARILLLELMAAVAVVFSASAAPLDLPHYFPRSWKTDNGLPDNAVTAVAQTRDGYLWLGTYGGVARFDGVSFTVFNTGNTPSLQSDRVTALFEDAQSTLWIGHERGDLTSCHDGIFTAADVHETGVRRKINGIGADADGDIWMLNEEGTLLRARDSATCSMPNHDGMAMMAQNSSGRLWVASGGQVAAMMHGRLVSLMTTNDASTNAFSGYVQGACASHDGGLWVVIDGQVKKWNGRYWAENLGTNPCASNISAMSETASGTLALGTVDSGLYLLFPDRQVLHFSQAEGFPHDWIRCLFEDREGTVWTGAGSAGLVALRPGKVATLDPPDHWQGRVTLSVTTARDGAFWASTEGNGVYRFLDGAEEHFGESSGFSNEFIWCVSEDLKGRVWAGTWGGGMFMEEDGRFVFPPGLENVTVPMPAILHGADGVTWIGTASGLIRYDSGLVKWFGEPEGLRSPDVRTIIQEQDGTVWFGMLGGGLGRLRNGSVKQYLKRDGLPNDYVQCLHFDPAGALWIGTYGSGLARFKEDHFARITTEEGLPNNFICAIANDQRGNFWISSHNGIFRVSEKDLTACAEGRAASVACLAYGKGDGMPSLECSGGLQPATCTLADGRICFPTSKGVVMVNPEDIKINRRPPPVVIEEVVAGGREFADHPDGTATRKLPLKIPPGLQRFEFHYAGLSFVAPEKMQFQYRLEGWEKEWVDAANNKRVAEYSYIPPGNYTFHVRACNSDGVWNEAGASFALQVLPNFWQTWWFHTVAVLASVALVVGTVLFVTRRRMRLKLERIERQQALERERTRIAKDIHDHLGANLTRISLLSQSAHSELENPVHAAAQLNRIYDTSRELTRAMDEIVWAVNPQHDTLDSLASYLGNFAQDYLVSINIRCRLDMPLHLPPWPITAEVRHNVFLAFKEALHNVVKHSGATEASVLLATTERGFILTVRDNGQGFEPANLTTRPGRGNGLKNMRQRLEKSGGHCTIISTPGTGTEVEFTLAVSEWVREMK